MFIHDKLIFVELHKTAGTHITGLLRDLLGGEQRGKHNAVPRALLESGRTILGSIRNPWDWYLSLWAYGCDRRGAVHASVTRPRGRVGGKSLKRNPLHSARALLNDLVRDQGRWKRVYSSVDDPAGFREWLGMMHDPGCWNDFAVTYGTLRLSEFSGYMSFRYLNLFCDGRMRSIKTPEQAIAYDRERNYIDHFIRTECLERDFIDTLQRCGVALSESQISRVHSGGKTNASSRSRPASYYYDPATLDLVARREQLIIDRFGYQPPEL